jgi:hypothetical protein
VVGGSLTTETTSAATTPFTDGVTLPKAEEPVVPLDGGSPTRDGGAVFLST